MTDERLFHPTDSFRPKALATGVQSHAWLWRVNSAFRFPVPAVATARAELETRLRELVKNGEDHVPLIDVGPADKIELAMESIGKTFSKIVRQATVI